MKEYLNNIFYGLAYLLWPSYMRSGGYLKPKLVLKCWVIQKVFRVNSKVPWPVHWSSTVVSPSKIKRGDRCPGLSMGCHIDGRNGLVIGNNVWIGPRVTIVSMNHNVHNYNEYVEESSITIGNNCWLGANSIILPGVKLGDHTVVAAGAVVTKSFNDGDIILAGSPARIIRKISKYAS